jgi:hypothetical protein
MLRALRRIGAYDHALIDGRDVRDVDLGPHTAVVDGDATSFAIACASIVAKVTRDRLMVKLAARHPAYGWEHNVGYSTRAHLAAMREHGLTCYHRRGYQPVRAILHAEQTTLAFEAAPIPEGHDLRIEDAVSMEREMTLSITPHDPVEARSDEATDEEDRDVDNACEIAGGVDG